MTPVTIKGLAGWRRRLEAKGLGQAVADTVRREAADIAADAARGAPGRLGGTVEVKDISGVGDVAYAVGTSHRAGRFLEHGTVRRPATPWLWPVFRARLPRVKHALRNTVIASLTRPRSAV